MSHEIKTPPHSIQAEQSVIGALLRDNDSFDRMGDLRPEHFYLGDNATIFSEITKYVVAGQTADVVTMMVALDKKIPNAGRYLNDMAQSCPSSATIRRYADIVRDKAIKRGLIAFGADTADGAANDGEDAAAMVDRASSRLEKLAEARVVIEPARASDEMAAHIGEIEKRMEGGGRAISTGYPALDARLSGGMRGGDLIVLAGRPKMGKTALALNIATSASLDHSGLVLSLEMPKSQIHDRNLASLGSIPLSHLMQPNDMTDQDWSGLTHATLKIQDLNLYLDDQGGLRLIDVRMKAKGVKRKRGLDFMIVDYLQLMEGDGDNRNTQIEGITRGLKALAKELDIAIVLLSQLNRKLEERPDKRPKPSDLRDSGSIEQDADAVILLYRDEVYNPDTREVGICEIDVALCRQGKPGRVALAYEGEYTRFKSLERPWAAPAKTEERGRGRGLAASL